MKTRYWLHKSTFIIIYISDRGSVKLFMTESCRYFKSSATTTKRIVEKNWVFFFFFVSVASSNIICNTGTVTFQEIRKWKNILFSFPTMWKNSVKMQGKNLKSNISFDKLNFFEKNKMCFLRQEFNTLFPNLILHPRV